MAKTPGTGIAIGTHFSPRFKRPIDDRYTFDTIAEMKSFSEAALYNGIETFNNQDKKTYKYLSTNSVDPTIGKWRVISNYSSDEIDELLSKKQDIIAVDTLPIITSTTDKTYAYLYKGETTTVAPIYTHGHLYIIGDDNKYHDAYDVYTKEEVDELLDEKENIFIYLTMPEANVSNLDKVVLYSGVSDDDHKEGHLYKCKFDGLNYAWDDLTDFYTKSEADTKFQKIIQYEVLPEASKELVNKVYQYIGVKTSTRRVGSFYKCVEKTTNVYDWVELQPEVESTQKETLPVPTIDLVNKIYQYIGPNVLGSYQKGYFYICQENIETPGTYIWKQKNVQPSSEGGSTLERDITANIDLGGIIAGKTFLEGTSITDILETLIYKPVDQKVIVTLSENLLQKIGTVLSSVNVSANITKGDYPIVSAKYYVNDTLEDTKDETTDPTITDGGTFIYTYNTEITSNTTFKVDVATLEKTVSEIKTIEFIRPFYYGISDTAVIDDPTILTELLEVKDNKSVIYTSDNKYLVFAYDKSYGDLKKILDENDFQNLNDWTKSTVGEYFVYVSNTPTTITNYTYKFEF